MDIKDVKVGDRCWAAFPWECDEYGQNCTVTSFKQENKVEVTRLGFDNPCAWYTEPGIDLFWRKPEAPPKPKRKVTKTGWINLYESPPDVPKDRYLGSVYDTEQRALNMRLPRCIATINIEWQEEE